MKPIYELLEASAVLHRHLCPRQVLGVRIGMWAGELLGLDLPQASDVKRLLSIVETDGCFSDGVAVACNCWVGRRTMRLEDYGKVAATFVDTQTGCAVRIVPRPGARAAARAYAPRARNTWEAQLLGYQRIPASELLTRQAVQLNTPIERLLSRPGVRVCCDICGEEILNERQVVHEDTTLCRPCAGQGYYQLVLPVPAETVRMPIVAEPA
jgi:formylmethanofuran dehydrogenase subunit E